MSRPNHPEPQARILEPRLIVRSTTAALARRELAGVEGTTDLWYFDTKKLQSPLVRALESRSPGGIDHPFFSIVS